MASNIISATIDAEYPVAGQDNDTQGFRDNFATIKDSLSAAKLEIEDLQENSAVLNGANDFNGNNVNDVNLVSATEEFINNGTATSDKNISFITGHYQVFTANDDISFNFTDWPDSGRLAKIRVELIANDTSIRTLTFTSDGGGTMLTDGDFPAPFTVQNNTDHYVIDAWTYNSGSTVFLKFVGVFS